MYNHQHYTYRITWSEEDQEHVGLCAEFPGLSYIAESKQDALQGIEDVVDEVVQDMANSGEDIPEPLAIKKFSGKFMVRVTPHQHRSITIRAKEQGVSINRLVSSELLA